MPTIPAPNQPPAESHFASLCRAAGVDRLASIGWLSYSQYVAAVLAAEARRAVAS